MTSAIDPVSLEILWSRLIAVADEAATTLVRTSFSPTVRESNDYACVLFDAAGNAIAENTIGIPSFNMTLSRTLSHFLRIRPRESWRPGDVGITNDPWIASGHLPDVTIVAPVFMDERLVAWSGSVAHMVDIGGVGWSADARQIFEEGLRIPPMMFLREGRPNEDLLQLLRANNRLPDAVVGDLMAMVAAARMSEERLVEVISDARLADLSELSAEIRARAEHSMRAAIAAVPDGRYHSVLDLDGAPGEPIHLEVTVTVAGEEMTVDYAGTSPQVSSGLNTVMNYTEAYSCYPLKCLLDPSTPRNEGSYRMIHVRAPEGSILNPSFPAPVNARQLVGHVLAGMLCDALSSAMPERIIGESGSAPTMRCMITGSREDGSAFTSILFINGGMGARPDSDGLPTTCFPSTVMAGAMEAVEAVAPVRIWRKEFAPDSGGPGKFRGGLGQDVEVEVLGVKNAIASLFVERTRIAARGVLGGGLGAVRAVQINGRSDGFPLKGRSRIAAGDRVTIRYAGGGGYGNPRERDRASVIADVEAGVVSKEAARKEYGLE
jgi:N-methylhydantoinase B